MNTTDQLTNRKLHRIITRIEANALGLPPKDQVSVFYERVLKMKKAAFYAKKDECLDRFLTLLKKT